MVSAYMDLLATNEAYLQSVQNALGRYIDLAARDERSEALRTELLRRIQKDADRTIYSDLLIWMYVQQKDMDAAFIQSKALDKRTGGNGDRLMELGAIALNNRAYATAVKCYEQVTAMGADRPNYLAARIGLVKAMDARVTEQPEPLLEDLQALEDQYEVAISELGRTSTTSELLRGLALLKAYHLNDAKGAMALLEDAVATPGLEPRQQAELKLDLGDIHVLAGDIWEASLLYSQVDLDFKYDMIGHEARFRNARVSFYAGDMLWCQAQLDVLKASTSKLIANDAMELSLLITDNLGLDSNSAPLTLYAQAELLTFQHRYDEAVSVLDSLDRAFPMHSLGDEVLFTRYRIAYARHRFQEAATHLVKITEQYPLDILMDNALLELGRLYEERLDDPEKAQECYRKLLFEHSGSIFVPEARERFRNLRGDLPDDREETAPPPTGQP
jgi:tetratricopeptide (TPR) repeat protein